MKKSVVPVVFFIAMLISTAPALAKSTIGGVVFVNTYGSDYDNGAIENRKTVVKIADNSRIRVRWSNEDNVGMYIEMGLGSNVYLRHAYGTWEINERWQILAGQTSSPFAPLNPSVAMLHNSGQSVGNISTGRQSQVRLTYKFPNRQGAFAIAFLDANGGTTLQSPLLHEDIGIKSADFPRVDMGIAYKAFNWQIFPGIFYQSQGYENLSEGSVDKVDSWGASIGAKRGFGPLVVSFEYGVGQNWGNTTLSQRGSPAGDNASALLYLFQGVNTLADNDNKNYWLDAGYRFTLGEVKGVLHVIGGKSTSELVDLNGDYESSMLGMSIPMDLPWIARGFRIRPELFVFDYSEVNVVKEAGETLNLGIQTMLGVQLQYSF